MAALSMSNKQLKVAAIAMDERSLNTLRLFFQGPCKNRCILVEEAAAEIALVNMDAIRAEELFETHRRRYPERPMIVLSVGERDIEGTIYVRKPMSAHRLLCALEEVRTRPQRSPERRPLNQQPSDSDKPSTPDRDLSRSNEVPIGTKRTVSRVGSTTAAHQAALQLSEDDFKNTIGSAPDIDPNDPAQLAKAYFDPHGYLLSNVRKAYEIALDKNAAVRMEGSWSPITLFAQEGHVHVDMHDSQLRSVCIVPNDDTDIRICVLPANQAALEYTHFATQRALQDVDAFVWRIALWTSRGRVPAGTDLSTPIFLRHWPCMTRLLITPHALRIAALWAHRPHSLLQTAQALRIPQRYVFAFYSAAHTLDLAGLSRRDADMLVEPSTVRPKNHGLLARILGRLKSAKNT